MKRRVLLSGLGATVLGFALPGQARSQITPRARLGWLSGAVKRAQETSPLTILRETLSELGWNVGETLEIEEREAEGDASKLPRLAAEIVALRPNVIACTGGTEAKALQAATREIPIVFMQVPIDPVVAGLVESISRPGGNLTGFLQTPQLLSGKRLDILGELLGRPPRQVAYVLNPGNMNVPKLEADAAQAASQIGAKVRRVFVTAPTDLERAFAEMHEVDAAIVQHDFMFVGLGIEFAEVARRRRVPLMFENRGHVEAGGLVSYGADLREGYRQGAVYVDRILKGAHPRDLPVVQATRFELVVNARAAKALGLTIPPTLLARADEVIE